jgi:hypothetical protein
MNSRIKFHVNSWCFGDIVGRTFDDMVECRGDIGPERGKRLGRICASSGRIREWRDERPGRGNFLAFAFG